MTGHHRVSRRRNYSSRVRDVSARRRSTHPEPEPRPEVLLRCRTCDVALIEQASPDALILTTRTFGYTEDDHAYCGDCLEVNPLPTTFISAAAAS